MTVHTTGRVSDARSKQAIVALKDFQLLSGLDITSFCRYIGRSRQWWALVMSGKPAHIRGSIIAKLVACNANPEYFYNSSASMFRNPVTGKTMSAADFRAEIQKRV